MTGPTGGAGPTGSAATGPTGRTFTGPTGGQATGPTGRNSTSYSFSAMIPSLSVSSNTQLSTFTTASPFYTGTGLNASTGDYTVPVSGDYSFKISINYALTAALNVNLGAGVNPSIELRRTSPSTSVLLSGTFPVLNVNIALLLTLRALLGSGQVNITGNVRLNAGDVVGLYYVASGLGVTVNLSGSSSTPGVVWSVNSLF